jgi:hypothetical protein
MAQKASRWGISRRDFFKLTGIGGAVTLGVDGCSLFPAFTPTFSTTLLRREDLVALHIDFVNLTLATAMDGTQQIVPNGAGQSFIIVNFQPQHILEEALPEEAPPPMPPKPVDARIAGGSRVVLIVPPDKTPIPYTSEGLLGALGSLQMNVAPNALPPPPPPPMITLLPPPVIIANGMLDPQAITRQQQLMAAGQQLAISTGLDTSVLTLPNIDDAATAAAAAFPLPPGVTPAQVGSVVGTLFQLPPRPRAPFNGETALELPFRLQLSPNSSNGWAHNNDAMKGFKLGRYELWHTRLGVRDATTGAVSEAPSYLKAVRAIWTRDPHFTNPASFTSTPACDALNPLDDPFPGSLSSITPSQRAQIVQKTSNFRDLIPHTYVPKAADTNLLMLSALGGWLDSKADFGAGSPLGVIEWDHKASMGRDYFVKIVEQGRLYPWGHFAVKITITERKFIDPDEHTGYLWQRKFIVVTEPTRTYPPDWRKFPFTSITVKTLVTPNLAIPTPPPEATQIVLGDGTPFRFKFEGVDVEGHLHKFDGVSAWVPVDGTIIQPTELTAAIDAYNKFDETMSGGPNHRDSGLDNQRVAYSKNKKADDTTYETETITFGGTPDGSQPMGVTFPGGTVGFLPHIETAMLNVEAIRHLVGQNAPTAFEYAGQYLSQGFPGIVGGSTNTGELLMQLKDLSSPIGLDFSKKSDSSGGFLAPSLDITGLSRITGPVAGKDLTALDQVAGNSFDPSSFLGSINALVFGVIPLQKIIDSLGGLASAPSFVTQTVNAVTGFINDVMDLKARIEKAIADIEAKGMMAADQLKKVHDDVDTVVMSINGLLSASDVDAAVTATSTIIDNFETLLDDLLGVVDMLPNPPILLSVSTDLKKKAQSIKDVLDEVKKVLKAFATGLELAKNLTVKLDWTAKLKADDDGFFVPQMDGGFLLSVEVRGKQVGDKPPGFDVTAGLEKFDVNVFGTAATLVTIPFEHLLFVVDSGKKPDIDVKFRGDVGFDGILAFVKTLAELVPGGGFSDPPSLDVSAEGIKASFSVAIPSISVGVFAIENISLGGGFEVPFIGNPLSVAFNFCTRDEPFVLTVMCIGGGGFFGVKLSPAGLLLLEAALEARAELSLDLGIASGSVSLAVGVYFRLEESGGKQTGSLTGYIRIHGEVDVLGLITASITLELDLIYEFSSGKLIGKATLTIEVSIAFFSFSVSVTVERKLAGSDSDPSFAAQMSDYMLPDGSTAHPWADYLGSFLLAA